MGLHDMDTSGPTQAPPPIPSWLGHAGGPVEPAAPPPPPPPPPAQASLPYRLLKYFVHGLLLNVLMVLAGLLWVVPALLLVVCGLWIGLIIAFVLLLVIYGYVNAFVTGFLWFPVETGFLKCLLHGLLLVLASLLVAFPLALLGVGFTWAGAQLTLFFFAFPLPNPLVLAAWFVFGSIVEGWLGMHVAEIWRVETRVPELDEGVAVD